ncbi:hypothetical protein D3C75_309950 [compost metagenome]
MRISSKNKDIADQEIKEYFIRKNNSNHLLNGNGTGRFASCRLIFDAEDYQDDGVKEINGSAQHKRQHG